MSFEHFQDGHHGGHFNNSESPCSPPTKFQLNLTYHSKDVENEKILTTDGRRTKGHMLTLSSWLANKDCYETTFVDIGTSIYRQIFATDNERRVSCENEDSKGLDQSAYLLYLTLNVWIT